MNINGISAKKIIEPIKQSINLKDRSSYNQSILLQDVNKVKSVLKSLGYYFAEVETSVEVLNDNKINLIYDIKLGEKAKISKITFTAKKIFKEKKLTTINAT